jgi:hypothetical protein
LGQYPPHVQQFSQTLNRDDLQPVSLTSSAAVKQSYMPTSVHALRAQPLTCSTSSLKLLCAAGMGISSKHNHLYTPHSAAVYRKRQHKRCNGSYQTIWRMHAQSQGCSGQVLVPVGTRLTLRSAAEVVAPNIESAKSCGMMEYHQAMQTG